MKLKKFVGSALLATLFAGGSVLLASTTANAVGCGAFANTPYKTTAGHGSAKATAGRSNCSGTAVKIDIRLMHYQPNWTDITRDDRSSNAVNWNGSLSWARPNTSTANGWTWYSDAKTSTGQSAKSANKVLWS